MSTILNDDNRFFASLATKTTSMLYALVMPNHHISCTQAQMIPLSKFGTAEVWEMDARLVFSLAIPKD